MPIREVDPSVQPPRTRRGKFPIEDQDAAHEILSRGNTAIHGEYETDRQARSAGMILSRAIEKRHGARWRVTAWLDEGSGKYIGALVAKERIRFQRKPKDEDDNEGKGKGKRS